MSSSQATKRLVVAAAIIHEDRILAARRRYPPQLAGKWEFPGGKVELGESPPAALHRELAEELGVRVRLGSEITAPMGGAWPIDGRLELRLWWAWLLDPQPRPGASHDRLAWLGLAELPSVAWLAPDEPMVARLVSLGIPPAPD